jgi:hypothetical protein
MKQKVPTINQLTILAYVFDGLNRNIEDLGLRPEQMDKDERFIFTVRNKILTILKLYQSQLKKINDVSNYVYQDITKKYNEDFHYNTFLVSWMLLSMFIDEIGQKEFKIISGQNSIGIFDEAMEYLKDNETEEKINNSLVFAEDLFYKILDVKGIL